MPEACVRHDAMWPISQAARRTLSSISPALSGRAGAAHHFVTRLNRGRGLRFSARSCRAGSRQRDDAPRACEKVALGGLP
jgi:hypothetical protein